MCELGTCHWHEMSPKKKSQFNFGNCVSLSSSCYLFKPFFVSDDLLEAVNSSTKDGNQFKTRAISLSGRSIA